MNAREPMRYAMFGAAAALFVVGGLTAGQIMGARSLEHAQAAAFQPFGYVTQKDEGPKQADPTVETAEEPTATMEPTATESAEVTATTANNSGADTQPQVTRPTNVPANMPDADPTAPPAQPTQESTAAPTIEPTVEVTPEPETEPEGPTTEPEEPEVTPEPDPDPPAGDDVLEIDPCIIDPMGPGCDDAVEPNPNLEFHPCTFTLEPCPGEEEDDGPMVVYPVDPCIIVECIPVPEMELVPIQPVNPVLRTMPTYQINP